MSDEKKKLRVNCGLALLLNDRDGVMDNYDSISINSGTVVVSSGINNKLSAKGAKINCGNLQVRDIKGEIVQLDKGVAIDGSASLNGYFIIAKDDLLITKEGMQALAGAEGLIGLEKIYYPQSSDMASLIKMTGEKRAYPDDAHVILGDHSAENILAIYNGDKKHIWISGRLTALDRKALENFKVRGIKISSQKLFTYQSLNDEFGSMINCTDRFLVPDGYEITGSLKGNELALYGTRIYVDGKFSMEEKDIAALEAIQSIIVRGKASLPEKAVKIFKDRGKAEEYFVFEGRYVEINGFEQFSHNQLQASVKNAEKLTMQVNGCLLFDDDVTPEDIECIASLSYNGPVFISGAAKAALALKIKTGNGFMGDPSKLEEMTGQSMWDFMGRKPSGDSGNSRDTNINLATYILA